VTLEFLPANHPINRIRPELLERLRRAQLNLITRQFGSARELCEQACREAGVDARLAESLRREPLLPFADLSRSSLIAKLLTAGASLGLSQAAVSLVAERVQLIRAFEDPASVVETVRKKVELVVSKFPTKAAHIEQGTNPGDLLDPFITAATQELMYGGSVQGAIEATASHKAMMMIEGLIGHLHEDVIGAMRGNVRVPEPRGVEQEELDFVANPFPGADIAQPPWGEGQAKVRFHQVKSKTGSAKGGDAKRLGQQLKLLSKTYQADVYYDALIGKSLKGHRSKAGVLREAPIAVVLVGQAAFLALTGSASGAELLLRVYQSAFRDVAHSSGYSIGKIAGAIAAEFRSRAKSEGDDFLQLLLHDVTSGDPREQDSRSYKSQGRGRKAAE